MTITVIGGSGFVGTRLVKRLLAAEYSIFCYFTPNRV